MRSRALLFLGFSICAVLASCGGGGGGSNPPVNQGPQVIAFGSQPVTAMVGQIVVVEAPSAILTSGQSYGLSWIDAGGVGALMTQGVATSTTQMVLQGPNLAAASYQVDVNLGAATGRFRVALAAAPVVEVVPEMVAIAAGTFQMGSPQPVGVDPYFNQTESQPVHSVSITRRFWMSKYEIKQSTYQSIVGSNPSFFVGANRPVEQVSWNDAVAYCAGLTAQETAAGRVPSGYQYRLPTEAEWEYCCRAGTTTEFHYGSSLVCEQAKFSFSHHANVSCNDGNEHAVVGSYASNAWGLFDMHGNVWEWCLDSWDVSANYYPSGAVADPYVRSGSYRILRGGSWLHESHICRSATRGGDQPDYRGYGGGFRVVLAPVLTP